MRRIALELFSCLSRVVNVILGGGADLTFSARAYRDSLKAEKAIDWFFWKVFGEKDHCKVWWDFEIKRSLDNINADKKITKSSEE